MSRRSRANGPRITPKSTSPINAMMTPPTRSTEVWNWCSDEPSSPAAAPKLANTVANPSTNTNVAGTALAVSWASAVSPTMIPR